MRQLALELRAANTYVLLAYVPHAPELVAGDPGDCRARAIRTSRRLVRLARELDVPFFDGIRFVRGARSRPGRLLTTNTINTGMRRGTRCSPMRSSRCSPACRSTKAPDEALDGPSAPRPARRGREPDRGPLARAGSRAGTRYRSRGAAPFRAGVARRRLGRRPRSRRSRRRVTACCRAHGARACGRAVSRGLPRAPTCSSRTTSPPCSGSRQCERPRAASGTATSRPSGSTGARCSPRSRRRARPHPSAYPWADGAFARQLARLDARRPRATRLDRRARRARRGAARRRAREQRVHGRRGRARVRDRGARCAGPASRRPPRRRPRAGAAVRGLGDQPARREERARLPRGAAPRARAGARARGARGRARRRAARAARSGLGGCARSAQGPLDDARYAQLLAGARLRRGAEPRRAVRARAARGDGARARGARLAAAAGPRRASSTA